MTGLSCSDNNQAAKILQQTLDEEGEADKKLTEIAQSLNVEADPRREDEETTVSARAPFGRKQPIRRQDRVRGNPEAKPARSRPRGDRALSFS